MEPRIQYAKTKDGVSIAYVIHGEGGEGTPVIEMPLMPWSHIQMQHQLPDWVQWSERLSENRMVIRYDGRGTGLSQRDVSEYSLDSQMFDLER